MPAILLVKVADAPVAESPDRWKAGEIIAAVPVGHEFGSLELPAVGNIYHMTVTNRTVGQVEAYLHPWMHEPTSNVDSSDGSGGYRVTITSTAVSASGRNAITRAQMDAFIEKWGGVYVSHTNTTYTFDITAFDAATSAGFFGPQVSAVTFVDEGFAGGTQQIGITDFGPFTSAQVAKVVTQNGGTIVDSDSFTLPAATIYDRFKDDIEAGWRSISYKRRRWNINAAGMALLAGNGGAVSATAAQIVSYLDDGLLT